jgi:hypothetical protein
VLRFGTIGYEGRQAADGVPGARAPERFSLTGTWEADTVTLSVEVDHALATEMDVGSLRRHFIQMRGRFRLSGRIMGEPVSDRGEGFFETYLAR